MQIKHVCFCYSQYFTGKRLDQPAMASIDIWDIMFKCWLCSPAQRPTFLNAAQELREMAKRPVQYIILTVCQYKREVVRSRYRTDF